MIRKQERVYIPCWLNVLEDIGKNTEIYYSKIARNTGHNIVTIIKCVSEFEKKGWVSKRSNPKRKHEILVKLTNKGEQPYKKVLALLQEVKQ